MVLETRDRAKNKTKNMVKISSQVQNRLQKRINFKIFKKNSKLNRSNWGEWFDGIDSFSSEVQDFIRDKKLLKGMAHFYLTLPMPKGEGILGSTSLR